MEPSLWTGPTQAGVALALVAAMVYILRSNHADRAQSAAIRAQAEREHEQELAHLREQLTQSRTYSDRLEAALDAERRLRRSAEDRADRFRRMAGVNEDD